MRLTAFIAALVALVLLGCYLQLHFAVP